MINNHILSTSRPVFRTHCSSGPTLKADGMHLLHPTRSTQHTTICFCYFANRSGAKYCNQRVCTSVCPLACLKNHMSKLHQIFCILPMVIARSSSDNNVVYGKAYGRGMSVSGRQCKEGQSFSTSGRPLSALPPAD